MRAGDGIGIAQMIDVNGVLLIYHHELRPNANTIMEHVCAFERHSKFKVWKINTELGFPRELNSLRFDAVILHYSLFGIPPYKIPARFNEFIQHSHARYIMAFFQDEYRACQMRFKLINDHDVDCVVTLLEPRYFKDTYEKYTKVRKLIHNIPGYVSDDVVNAAQRHGLPDDARAVDIGYRARPLAFYMGAGAMEKTRIADDFKKHARGLDLRLDIETAESKRIYGPAWHTFIANCRAFLGVESGVSVFDVEDVVYGEYVKIIKAEPGISFEEFSSRVLQPWEGKIQYRTIGPRNFEAAAFRVCQILYPGHYSGLMERDVHYIALEKDFSNFADVIRRFRDKDERRRIAEKARADLIDSGRHTYQGMIKTVDGVLREQGFKPQNDDAQYAQIQGKLQSDYRRRHMVAQMRQLLRTEFPGRRYVASAVRPLRRMMAGNQQ